MKALVLLSSWLAFFAGSLAFAEDASSDTKKPQEITVKDSVIRLDASLKTASKRVKKMGQAVDKIKGAEQVRSAALKQKQPTQSVDELLLQYRTELKVEAEGLRADFAQVNQDFQQLKSAQEQIDKETVWNSFSAGIGVLTSKKVPSGKKPVSNFKQTNLDTSQDEISFVSEEVSPVVLAVGTYMFNTGVGFSLAVNPVALANKGANLGEVGFGISLPMGVSRHYVISAGKYFQKNIELVSIDRNSGDKVAAGESVLSHGPVESFFVTISYALNAF